MTVYLCTGNATAGQRNKASTGHLFRELVLRTRIYVVIQGVRCRCSFHTKSPETLRMSFLGVERLDATETFTIGISTI